MIAELAQAILNELNAAGLEVSEIDYKNILSQRVGHLKRPVVNIFIDQSTFKKVTMTKYKSELTVSLLLVLHNASVDGEKLIKFATYSLIENIIKTLMLKDLGVGLQDKLRPLGFNNVTPKEYEDASFILYQLNFYGSFVFSPEEAEEDADEGLLKSIVNDHFLQDPNDDGESDKQTIVTFNSIYGGGPWTKKIMFINGGGPNAVYGPEPLYGGRPGSTY